MQIGPNFFPFLFTQDFNFANYNSFLKKNKLKRPWLLLSFF